MNDGESHTLTIKTDKFPINVQRDVGTLRALETLLQLTNLNKTCYYFEGITIKDSPRLVRRGLMIDAARHFQPIGVLKGNLEAIAFVKWNVFHQHLTDDYGFRVESKLYLKLQEFASDGLFYAQEQIKEIVRYALNLGIWVIPEFEFPGHALAIFNCISSISK